MDRTQLFDTLSNLPPAAFERLLIAVNMPRMNRVGAAATIGEQVSALLAWAESPIGPGIEAIARHLAELNRFEFDAYLRSLVATYEKWWEYYTLTDVEGKVNPPAPEKPSVFDFGLMVQTVVKETDSHGSDLRAEEREKTERLPVLEGIRKYADDHVLLVGRPGSGKSTALIRLLLEEATQTLQQSEGQVPVLVELRYWSTSIEGLIQGFLQRHGLTLDDSTLSTLLSQGRFLLLVDGLNELPSESARTQLSAFRRNHPKVPMIFTTRDLGLGGDLGIEKKLEMQPLTEPQMKDFIRAYVPDQAEAMLRQLNNRLREFGQTPLLLWMLCEVFQQSPNRQMPNNLAEVFRAFTTMYEDSSVRKHEVALLKGDVRPLSDRRLWKEALKALAALMMQGKTPVDFRVAIQRAEAERELGKLFAKERFPVRDILDDLLKYHLLQNRTTDQLEFRHQLIQEYYAAEHLLQLLPNLSDEQLKRDYLNLLKWTEPVVLMLALVDDKDQALRVVKLTMNQVDLMLAARLAGAVRPVYQKHTIEPLCSLREPEWLKCRLLEEAGSDHAVEQLSHYLSASDWRLRVSTVEALGRIGSNKAIFYLLKGFEDQESEVIYETASWLSRLKPKSFIPELMELVNSLKGYSQDKLVNVILKIIDNPDLREQYKCLISQCKPVKQVIELGAWMRTQDVHLKLSDDEVNEFFRTSEEDVHADLDEIKTLIDLLNLIESRKHMTMDSDWHIREKVLIDLQREITPKFISAIRSKDQNLLSESLFLANSIVRFANRLIDDSDWRVRETLSAFVSETVVSPLHKEKLWESFDFKEPLQKGRQILLRLARDSCEDVRSRAIYELSNNPHEVAIPVFKNSLNDSNYSARAFAARALGSLKDATAVPALIRLLEDEATDVRVYSAQALSEISQNPISLVQYLPQWANLLRADWSSSSRYIQRLVVTVQSNCKFYNYNIFCNFISQGKTVALYFSYAPTDEALQTQLANHLTLLNRQGVITSWSTHQILPGSDRTQTIHQQLNTADIILLLISPDAIADDTCYHLEIQRAIERHQSGEARVIPILLRPVDWQSAPFSQLDVLPKNHQPVTTWPNPDQAFQEIAEGIRTVAMEVRKENRGE